MPRVGPQGEREEAERLRAGPLDERLLRWLYERHAASVYGYLRRVLDDDAAAEDVLQEAFIDLWRSLARYDPDRGPIRPWLMAIARSRALDWLRRRRVRERHETAAHGAGAIESEAPEAVGDDRHLGGTVLRQAVRRLPEEQRRALYLVYFLGLTHREAARRLRLPVGTLKGRLRLSVGHIRRWLQAGSKEG